MTIVTKQTVNLTKEIHLGFKELASLDADTVIALGKKDKVTGKPYPKQAEGYYLGSRETENRKGKSQLHFLQTPEGNLGLWGTTDMNRKLANVALGSMVRVTSNGTKPTPNGDMYVYKVEVDADNTIDVVELAAGVPTPAADYTPYEGDEDSDEVEAAMLADRAAKAAKVQEILNRNKKVK